jgi:hypothetical protein
MPTLFANDALHRLQPCPVPSRCPYCPAETPCHWIRWGHYKRYAADPDLASQKVAVPRWQCKIVARTFSLLPDALLPYCSIRTGVVLEWLQALYVEDTPLCSLGRRVHVARGTLRGLSARFRRALPHLRLPRRPVALPAATFLHALAKLEPPAMVSLFRGWKESEPKHSIVGIHQR